MKRNNIVGVSILFVLLIVTSCKKFLDVVPDNVATIDNAFTMRSQAEKFLFTCYSYMPKDADPNLNPALIGGDELWRPIDWAGPMLDIAQGFQNKVTPVAGHYWSGLYRGIRDCNIMLENIGNVPDMPEAEKRQWIAEVKFLKAYYHFYLVRMYGPIPLAKNNLPIDADINQVRVSRNTIDDCFNYITQLIDEATIDLPRNITDPSTSGRITLPIALSLKAKVLVTAASPLFNGNTDQVRIKNSDGTPLFNTTFSKVKWDSAAVACKRAITVCEQEGIKLFKFEQAVLPDVIITQLSIRNSLTQRWNSEIIWANTQSNSNDIQAMSQAHLDPASISNTAVRDNLSPTLKAAEMFYSKNGVPINEDKTWPYNERFALRTAGESDKLYLKKDYTTVALNFDREPRYYASLGFDGGIWYGQGRYDTNSDLWHIQGKNGQLHGKASDIFGSVTGYWPKKVVHYQNILDGTHYSQTNYPWPIIRLADLYLLYAEALNESEGPGPESYKYINLVRKRAGLQSVESSWEAFSVNPQKYTTQAGMRDIIHRERVNELAFEGHRFWDLRRWKEAAEKLNNPIKGWNLRQKLIADYYKPLTIFNQTFGTKDYFWPIAENDITINPNLVQNLGW